jgi:hypothetical protein
MWDPCIKNWISTWPITIFTLGAKFMTIQKFFVFHFSYLLCVSHLQKSAMWENTIIAIASIRLNTRANFVALVCDIIAIFWPGECHLVQAIINMSSRRELFLAGEWWFFGQVSRQQTIVQAITTREPSEKHAIAFPLPIPRVAVVQFLNGLKPSRHVLRLDCIPFGARWSIAWISRCSRGFSCVHKDNYARTGECRVFRCRFSSFFKILATFGCRMAVVGKIRVNGNRA